MSEGNVGLGVCLGKIYWGINFPWGNVGEGKLSGVGVQMPMQDYKCVRAAVVICTLLANAQIHKHAQTAFDYELIQLS